ncbi:MAG TPA: hypothetical protein VKE40_23975 [Gemmataceae bacterium]|nr:hypothetical protein [Gemmataceae bacterium]
MVVLAGLVARAEVGAAPRLPPGPDGGLHSDAAIRALAGADEPIRAADGVDDYLKLPCLSVVRPGQSRPRAEVFADLGLDEGRMRGRREEAVDKVIFLVWQVSPSYDLVCMTGSKGRANAGLDPFDPERLVYGVRIVRRPAEPKR